MDGSLDGVVEGSERPRRCTTVNSHRRTTSG
jgi:hypothetical protein